MIVHAGLYDSTLAALAQPHRSHPLHPCRPILYDRDDVIPMIKKTYDTTIRRLAYL